MNLKFKKNGSVAEHLNEMQSIINQLAPIKMVLDDELQAILLLSSLPNSWKTLIVSLSNLAQNGVVTMSQVIGNLLNEDVSRKSSNSFHS